MIYAEKIIARPAERDQQRWWDRVMQLYRFAVLLLLLAIGLFCPRGMSRADDMINCEGGRAKQRIEACSRIISTGASGGQQISKENIAVAYVNRGSAYAESGQLEKAIADYDAALSKNPNYATAFYNRGAAHADMGDADLAIADFDAAIRLNAQYAAAYNNRGIAYQFKGDVAKAIADYNEAIRYKPDYATAYNNRGDAYEKQGNLEQAAKDYRKALEIDPGHSTAAYNLKMLEEKR